jgi:hypothetical protein
VLASWGIFRDGAVSHSAYLRGRAGIAASYLGRKPSYDRVAFACIRAALDSASPPSLSAIARAERLSKQTVFRLKQDPQAALAALDAWGL